MVVRVDVNVLFAKGFGLKQNCSWPLRGKELDRANLYVEAPFIVKVGLLTANDGNLSLSKNSVVKRDRC